MTREPPPIRVEVDVSRAGLGELRVGGVDIGPAVTRATIELRAYALPTIALDLVPDSLATVVEGRLVVRDPDAVGVLIDALRAARTEAYRLRASDDLERIHGRDA